MVEIRERAKGKRKYYERILSDSAGNKRITQIIEYRMTKVEKNGYIYFLLYNDEMNSIKEFFRYINIEMSHQSYNSREQSAHAIRQLYCYLALSKTDIEKLSKKDIVNLQYFLLGYSTKNGTCSFKLKTQRKNNTVNDYISIYRSYLKYLGVDCKYIADGRTTEYLTVNALNETVSQKVTTFSSSLKEGTPVKRVPRYIIVDEFTDVIKIIREDGNLAGEIIVRLMYEYGLRIGEVLGITNEDVTEKIVDGSLKPVIYIRNRVSDDKKYQSAKTLMKVDNKEVYSSPNYRQEKIGFYVIYLTYDFYDILNDFIEVTLSKMKRLNRLDKSIADTVVRQKHYLENHYIFLNGVGTPLSSKSWNEYIKTVFMKSNIHIDSGVKKHNLNHRFRHGFAMFQVKYRNVNAFELKEMMRHSSVCSTMIYYNPTEEDEYNMKTEFVEDLYNLIPALKERPDMYGEKIKKT